MVKRDSEPLAIFIDRRALARPGMTEVASVLLRKKGTGAMAIYREVAINGMVGTIEDAMRQVLDCWAELPPEMQEAVDAFRIQLGAAIDSVYLVKRALDQEVHEVGRQARQGALEQPPGCPQLLLCFRRTGPLLQLAQLGVGKVGLADE